MKKYQMKKTKQQFLNSCVICGKPSNSKFQITDERFSSIPNRKICKSCFDAWVSDDGIYIHHKIVERMGGKIKK